MGYPPYLQLFRLGKALPTLHNEVRLSIADFLCHDTLSLLVEKNLPDLKENITLPLGEKLALIKVKYPDFNIEEVYPFHTTLSDDIDKEAFLLRSLNNPICLSA